MTVVWSYPTRILFGEGSAALIAQEASKLGGTRALLVTDEGVMNAGLVAPLVDGLTAAGIETTVYSGFSSNPLESEVLSGADAYRQHRADIIIAVGGGSPLD